jgi:hypothetical protein
LLYKINNFLLKNQYFILYLYILLVQFVNLPGLELNDALDNKLLFVYYLLTYFFNPFNERLFDIDYLFNNNKSI